jgi:hypothetical protein
MFHLLPKFILIIIFRQVECVLQYREINRYINAFIKRTMQFYTIKYSGQKILKHQIEIIKNAKLKINLSKIKKYNRFKIFKYIEKIYVLKCSYYTHILEHILSKNIIVENLYTIRSSLSHPLVLKNHMVLSGGYTTILSTYHPTIVIKNYLFVKSLFDIKFDKLVVKKFISGGRTYFPQYINYLKITKCTKDLRCNIPQNMQVHTLHIKNHKWAHEITKKIKHEVLILEYNSN